MIACHTGENILSISEMMSLLCFMSTMNLYIYNLILGKHSHYLFKIYNICFCLKSDSMEENHILMPGLKT